MDRRRRWMQFLLVGLVITSPAVRYLSHDLPLFFIANADMLAVPSIVESMQRHGVSALTDWYWPPAPYVLTDVVPYGVIWFALPNVWLAPAVFMVGQLAVLFAAIRWFARSFVDDRDAADWGAVAAFAVVVGFAVELVEPARFVLVSYYRAGSFMLCLVALGFLVRWVGLGRPDARRSVLVFEVATVALASASDPLLLPAAAGPILVLLLVLAFVPASRGGWSDERRAVMRHVGAVMLGVALGVAVNGWIVTDESTYGPSLTGGRLREQAKMILELFGDSSVVLRLAVLVAVLAAAAAVVRGPRGRVTPLMVILGFWIVSTGAHLAAMLLDTSEPALRYVQVVALLPLVWLGPMLAQRVSALQIGAGRPIPALLAVVASVVVIAPALGELDEVDAAYQAPEAACLDRMVPSDGVGVSGYWQARLIQLHSDFERDLAPLDGSGDPLRINASSEWFDQPYDFAVVGTTTPGWDLPLSLMEAMAPTARTEPCGTLLILDAGRGGLRLDRLAMEGGEVSFDGCDLGSMVGQVVAETCVIDVPSDVAGFASFGGYVSLQPGTYDIELDYTSTAPPEVTLGTAEVTRVRSYGGEVEVVLAAPVLAPTEPGPASLRLAVVVPDDGEGFVAEMRTITDGAHRYQVEGVTITRR